MNAFLSPSQAARVLNVSKARVCKLAKDGRFPNTMKVGNQYAIPIDDLQNYRPNPVGYPAGRPRA